MQHNASLQALLGEPVNPKYTRRILEIRFPVLLYISVNEQNQYRLIGKPGLPGGHFQFGKFNASRKEWSPAANQTGLIWESVEERDCVLHRIHRRPDAPMEIAFVQHAPTYTKLHDIQVLESIERVEITPFWDPKFAYQTSTCTLLGQCGCKIYQSLLETKTFQWGS